MGVPFRIIPQHVDFGEPAATRVRLLVVRRQFRSYASAASTGLPAAAKTVTKDSVPGLQFEPMRAVRDRRRAVSAA